MNRRERFMEFCLRQPAALVLLVLMLVPLLSGVAVIGYQDYQVISTPGNPASGYQRFFATSAGLGCLTSGGGSCLVATSGNATQINGASVPASDAVVGTNSSSQIVAATSASIYGLFSGTCSSTTYLSGSGACSTPSGSGFANPMTTQGDIIYGGTSGTPTRLAAGTSGYLLSTVGTGGAPVWVVPPSGGSGALTQIGQVVAAGSTGTMTFSSIAGTYSALMMQCFGRTGDANQAVGIGLEFNTDTGNDYVSQTVTGSGSTASAAFTPLGAPTSVSAFFLAGSTAASNYPGVATIFLPGYAGTTFYKALTSTFSIFEGGTTGTIFSEANTMAWTSTAAINEIQVLDNLGGHFSSGTTCTLYGVQ